MYIQLEVAISNVVSSEDYIRAVCRSLGREKILWTMSSLDNLGKQFAVDAINAGEMYSTMWNGTRIILVWFDENRSTFHEDVREKRFSRFRSL